MLYVSVFVDDSFDVVVDVTVFFLLMMMLFVVTIVGVVDVVVAVISNNNFLSKTMFSFSPKKFLQPRSELKSGHKNKKASKAILPRLSQKRRDHPIPLLIKSKVDNEALVELMMP